MKGTRPPADPQRRAAIQADLQREREVRQSGYREQALRIFPHVCARCGRAFDGKRLRELDVHHRDHDHRNNPPDGSNWELLCLYCHDNEHETYRDKVLLDAPHTSAKIRPSPIATPFAGLDDLLRKTPG
jgi:hypothetical protein